ncbi:MAG: helix-turn-helix transcriptional regulator [Eisenbergiella massiliensis]
MKELPELLKKKNGSEFQRLQEILEYSAKKNQILQQQKVVNDDILRKLLLGRLLCDTDESVWDDYKKVLPNAPFSVQKFWNLTVVIVKLNEFEKNKYDFKTSDEELLLYSVGNVCMEMLGTEYFVESTRQNEMETIFVLNRKLKEDKQYTLVKILEEVKAFCRENLDIELSIAMSGSANDIRELAELYKEAQDCMKYRLIYGDENILRKIICGENMKNNAMSCSAESKKRLLEALRIRKPDKIEIELENIEKEIAKLNCDYILFAVTEIITLIYTCLNDIYELRSKGKRIDFNRFSRLILEKDKLSDMFESLKKIVFGTFYYEDEVCSEEEPHFLHLVIEYIEKNYTDINLSLQNIADYMTLSPRSLSKKFKQCTDISVNDYILNYRMKQAAILLTDSNVSIKKVAESVGIINENYFYQLFKKQFGCTPREFKLNGGKIKHV